MPDITYIDQYINDGQKAVISARNLFNTVLVGEADDPTHIYRTGIEDFFLKYRNELQSIIQLYSVPESMYYKPKLLSLQLYGTTELWLAILRANGMRDTTEFHYPIAKIYNPSALKELIKVFFKREKKM